MAALLRLISYFADNYGVTSGPFQCRLPEALCVLPFLFPATVPGLFIGCLITNLMSTVGPLDIVFGSLATLLAAVWTARTRSRLLAPLPPVVCNGIIIGAMIAWYEVGFGPGFWTAFAFYGVTVALGELLACYVLGSLLLTALPRVPFFRERIPAARLDRAGWKAQPNL